MPITRTHSAQLAIDGDPPVGASATIYVQRLSDSSNVVGSPGSPVAMLEDGSTAGLFTYTPSAVYLIGVEYRAVVVITAGVNVYTLTEVFTANGFDVCDSPLATADDMKTRFDVRVLGELVVDDKSRVAAALLNSQPRLLAALCDATGAIASALRTAGNYTDDKLSELRIARDGRLIRLCCDLAIGYLYRARGGNMPGPIQQTFDLAQEELDLIRVGKHTLTSDENVEAGKPATFAVPYSTIQSQGRLSGLPIFPRNPPGT